MLTTVVAVVSTLYAWTLVERNTALLFEQGKTQKALNAKTSAELDARRQTMGALTAQASAGRFSHRMGQRFEGLAALTEAARIGRDLKLPADRIDALRDEAIACLMLPDLKPAGPPILLPGARTAFAFDDGMTRYALRRTDGTIVVRRIGDNREIARFTAKGDRDISVFAFSPDGRYLASRDDNTISVWDVDRKSLVWTVPGECSRAVFSPDSRRIAVAYGDKSSGDTTILVYEMATGRSRSWSGWPPVQSLAFRPNGSELAVAHFGNPGTCRILDAETGQQLRTISYSGPVANSGSVTWSPDGSTLAFLEGNSRIALFSAARGERGTTLELPLGARGGLSFCFHPAGTLLASNGWEGRLRIWDTASGRERLSLTGGHCAFSKDGRILVGRA